MLVLWMLYQIEKMRQAQFCCSQFVAATI